MLVNQLTEMLEFFLSNGGNANNGVLGSQLMGAMFATQLMEPKNLVKC